ncbi:MAG: radical SAM protein, partial [Candidatus Lokiarchaeota archaeon]|nr:radical SAM protein [Candidatus Lokiarchaeota archaeon]
RLQDLLLIFGNNQFTSLFKIKKAFSVLFYSILGTPAASEDGPIRLQIEITDRCNFDCIMCDRHNLQKIRTLDNIISYKTFKHMVENINPLYLTLNGLGEPLLNTDIYKFLELCNRKHITTSMPSNMSLMNDINIEKLVSNPPTILTFSLHGTNPQSFEEITRSSTFYRCIENFEKLLATMDRKKTIIRILCCLQSKNLEEYESMFQYLKKWELLDSFRLEPVFDFGVDSDIVPTYTQLKTAIANINKDINSITERQKKLFYIIWREKLIDLLSRKTLKNESPCLTPWISTYITATGKVLPCCYLTSEKYVMGNIYKNSFNEIWNGKKYRAFRRLLIDSRENIPECYGCFWNDYDRVRKYRLITFGQTRWLH